MQQLEKECEDIPMVASVFGALKGPKNGPLNGQLKIRNRWEHVDYTNGEHGYDYNIL